MYFCNMIDQATVEKIYDSADIVEIVSEFVSLKKRGSNYMGCCPFHNEKTPSFSVSPAKGIYKCFGCGKAGNAVTFVMEHEHLSYVDALKFVAKKYNIEVKERELSPEEQHRNDDRESMMVLLSFAQQYFSDILNKSAEGKSIGLSYFKERGFSLKIINKFQLGYSLDSRSEFSKAVLKEGYKKEFLVRTGLSIEKTDGLIDRFYGRVMFPIHSVSGRVIAFGARTLKADKGTAKYLNSPESDIYVKSKSLYGIFFAKKTLTQLNKCYLVEGYTDVISMHQAGIENVVASSGTSLTVEQIRLIKRFTPNVTVLYDGDAAGIKASLRGIDMLLEEGMNVKSLLLPDGEDPDSFARKYSVEELQSYIDNNEQDFISFKTKLLLNDAKNDPLKKAALITDIVKSISIIPDNITRSVYIKECSRMLDADEGMLFAEVSQLRRKRLTATNIQAEQPEQQTDGFKEYKQPIPDFVTGIYCDEQEKELIYYLLKYGEKALFVNELDQTETVAQYIIDQLKNDKLELQNLQYKQIFDEYEKILNSEVAVSIKHFINNPDEKICELTVNILSEKYSLSELWRKRQGIMEEEEDRLQRAVPKAIAVYKVKILNQAISKFMAQLDEATKVKDAEKIQLLIRQISLLNEHRRKFSQELERTIL